MSFFLCLKVTKNGLKCISLDYSLSKIKSIFKSPADTIAFNWSFSR